MDESPASGARHAGVPKGPASPGDLESTAVLLDRLRSGDEMAREHLVARYLPLLKRWASGRLPGSARGLADTDDLVQMALIRALKQIGSFEPRREGAFLAYLRRILLNLVRDEIRRSVRHPASGPVPEEVIDHRPSVIEEQMGREVVEAYESALARLPEAMQEAVILKLEFSFSHQQIADAIGSPSPNAARMMLSRALLRLSKIMDEHR